MCPAEISQQTVNSIAKGRLRTLVLTNTRQSTHFKNYVAGRSPNPNLEYIHLGEEGIEQNLCDKGNFPYNPFADSNTLYAGIDPLRALKILLFKRKVDAVICVFECTALVLLALRRLFLFRPPILLLEVSPKGWRPRDIVLDFVVPRVEGCFTLTEYAKSYVERTFRLKRPAFVVGYAVDEQFYDPHLVPPPLVSSEKFTILSVGDDSSRDYETLLEASSNLDIEVIIRTNRKLFFHGKRSSVVTLIDRRLSYFGLRELYGRADIVVLPLHQTDNAGGITTLFEAMSMEKAVICSETAMTREFIAHGETGLLFPTGDPAALRTCILNLMANTAAARQIGVRARDYILRECSMRMRTQRLAAAIRQCVAAERAD